MLLIIIILCITQGWGACARVHMWRSEDNLVASVHFFRIYLHGLGDLNSGLQACPPSIFTHWAIFAAPNIVFFGRTMYCSSEKCLCQAVCCWLLPTPSHYCLLDFTATWRPMVSISNSGLWAESVPSSWGPATALSSLFVSLPGISCCPRK